MKEGNTLTYTDDLGREVEYTTDRIVSDYNVGQLLYLDANLVGADLTYPQYDWPEDKLSKVTNTGSDLEVVAELEPTLIIMSDK